MQTDQTFMAGISSWAGLGDTVAINEIKMQGKA
jgi:hypothetical protein